MSRFEIVPHAGGYLLEMDGLPQSHVDLEDPRHLAMEYMAHLAAVLRGVNPPAPAPLRVTHVGGAAMTMPRWVQDVRPGSPQIVLEPDEALTTAVREQLPLPRGHRIRVRPQLGRPGLEALKDASAHAVVVDAFDEGRVPADLQTVEFFGHVARVLRPDGVLVMNSPDEPGWRHLADVVAGVRGAFGPDGSLALVAMRDVIKGRRYGNVVVVASHRPLDVDEITRQVGRWPFPSGVLAGAELARRTAAGRALTDGTARPSPAAPAPGAWRVR